MELLECTAFFAVAVGKGPLFHRSGVHTGNIPRDEDIPELLSSGIMHSIKKAREIDN